MANEPPTISWEVKEYEHRQRGVDWFWAIALLAGVIIGIMDFENGKQELKQILPLIENQSGLSNYTEQVRQRLSAKLLTPTQTQTPTTPQ